MKIEFTGHHMDVTPALRQFTEDKFTRLERHYDHIQNIHVTFKVEKNDQIAEATIGVRKGQLHAASPAADMYAAIDLLVDKLDRQLKKHKEKLRERD